ncbi:hypothetical protein JCM10212_005424 [Sporobolomyces blumeae]
MCACCHLPVWVWSSKTPDSPVLTRSSSRVAIADAPASSSNESARPKWFTVCGKGIVALPGKVAAKVGGWVRGHQDAKVDEGEKQVGEEEPVSTHSTSEKALDEARAERDGLTTEVVGSEGGHVDGEDKASKEVKESRIKAIWAKARGTTKGGEVVVHH